MTLIRATATLAAVALAPLCVSTAHAEASARLDRVPVVASPACAGSVSADAQVVPLQVGERVHDGVRVAVSYEAGVYDGSCALDVTVDWRNADTGASGTEDITAVSTIDGHYGFIGYANTTLDTGSGTVTIALSSHPGAQMHIAV